MIALRRAVPEDAIAIAAVHVAAWRSTYPGILPDRYLARLSVTRQALNYERAITSGVHVHVATNDPAGPSSPRIVGFTTGAAQRHALAESEIETLYVLDDFRDRGIGRDLMAALGHDLANDGCRSAFCWVLRDNPSRWFYQRIGGKEAASAMVRVAGTAIPQTAFVWKPLELLWAPANPPQPRRTV